jgi:hypothetical protein
MRAQQRSEQDVLKPRLIEGLFKRVKPGAAQPVTGIAWTKARPEIS